MFKIPEKLPNWFSKKVEVKASPGQGLGVFAIETIEKHEIFERAPVLVFSIDVFKAIKDTPHFDGRAHVLSSYVFNWVNGQCAVAWGNGCLYNHGNGNLSNSGYRMQTNIPCIEYYAKRIIEPGEEVLIHYLRGECDIQFSDSGSWFRDGAGVDGFMGGHGHQLTSLDAEWVDRGSKD